MEEDRKVECIYVSLLDILLYLPIFRRSDGVCLAFGITHRLSYRKAVVGLFWRFLEKHVCVVCIYCKRMWLKVKNLKLSLNYLVVG